MTVPEYLPILSSGSHSDPAEGACVMEYVSFLAGEPWTDSPTCTHPALAALAISVNDGTADQDRQKLAVLIPRLIGTSRTSWRIDLGMAVVALRRLWQVPTIQQWITVEQYADLKKAWDDLDRLADGGWWSWTAAAATATAAAAAAAATATAAATTARPGQPRGHRRGRPVRRHQRRRHQPPPPRRPPRPRRGHRPRPLDAPRAPADTGAHRQNSRSER